MTASGRHVPFGVPGDALLDDGALAPGPHHQDPPCRHFPECGGCQLQHVDDVAYRGYLVSRVETALAQHALATEIREPHLSPPNSRRRATLRALKVGQGAVVGFNAAKSHRIVDMQEIHILRPELLALLAAAAQLLAGLLQPRRTGRSAADAGRPRRRRASERRSRPMGWRRWRRSPAFAATQRLARLSIDRGLGPRRSTSRIPRPSPCRACPSRFPTAASSRRPQNGEAALVEAVREATSGTAADRRPVRGSGPSLSRCGRLMRPRPLAMRRPH